MQWNGEISRFDQKSQHGVEILRRILHRWPIFVLISAWFLWKKCLRMVGPQNLDFGDPPQNCFALISMRWNPGFAPISTRRNSVERNDEIQSKLQVMSQRLYCRQFDTEPTQKSLGIGSSVSRKTLRPNPKISGFSAFRFAQILALENVLGFFQKNRE